MSVCPPRQKLKIDFCGCPFYVSGASVLSRCESDHLNGSDGNCMPRERERESTMKSVFSHFQKIKPDGDRIVYLPTGVNWLVFGVFGGENSLLGKRECAHITL